MQPAQSLDSEMFLKLSEAAEILKVSVNTLLEWNDNNILKPTINKSGEVGYKKEQINKFLTIQKLSQINQIISSEALDFVLPQQEKNYLSEKIESEDSQNKYSKQIKVSNPGKKSNFTNIFSIGYKRYLPEIISSFSITAILFAIIFYQQNSLKSLQFQGGLSEQKIDSTGAVLSLNISDKNHTESITPRLQVPANDNSSLYDLKGTLTLNSEKKSTVPQPDFDSGFSPSQQDNATSISMLSENTKANIPNDDDLAAINKSYSEISNFASRANCPSCSENNDNAVLDDNGNIKGKSSETDFLASAFGASLIQNEKAFKQVVDPLLFLTFLTLGIGSLFIITKTQSAYQGVKINPSYEILNSNLLDDTKNQAVIELNQRTDGAVVLNFQGREYKISKPELNSETDQFIERLLSLSKGGVKEINYDSAKDEEIKINAPLSKLVTRLGFVGIKRDLFFPRTSKNNILFRRYLTSQDLTSMGLTTDRISSELTS